MTDNPIVEVMADAVLHADPASEEPRRTYRQQAESILAALEAAGLRVLPIKLTDEMWRAGSRKRESQLEVSCPELWYEMIFAFDPTTYTPEQSDDD